MLLSLLRKILNPLNILRFKLALWVGVLTWMILFTAYGSVLAYNFIKYGYGPAFVGSSGWDKVLTWTIPVWIIGTSVLVDIYVASFVGKRFGRKCELCGRPMGSEKGSVHKYCAEVEQYLADKSSEEVE
jgi:hypothetical protein